MSVAFLTSAELGDITADDRLVVGPLAARGIRVEPAVWTDVAVDYERFDLVVIRSTWDWHRHGKAFASFLERLEKRTAVQNERAHEWLDKRYLVQRLGARGVRVPPMYIVRSASELDAKLSTCGPRAVLKPATGASGHGAVRFDATDHEKAHAALDEILEIEGGGGALLQPYFASIETEGEWSLLFFAGEYSHAVKKRPREGEFRVQQEHGGSNVSATAPADVIEAAHGALHASDRDFLYARVDGMLIPELGGFCVTELEVVEPELFFRMDPASPERFARALASRLSSPRRA